MGKPRPKTGTQSEADPTPREQMNADTHEQKPIDSKLDQILSAISSTRDSLESRIDGVAEGLNLLRDDHRKLKEKVVQSEKPLDAMQPMLSDLRVQVGDLTDRVRFLEGRAEDAEGQNRRSNLRIVGLPEGEEGPDPLVFLEQWIRSFMPEGSLTPFFSLERAHRVPGRRPPRSAPQTIAGEAAPLPGPPCYIADRRASGRGRVEARVLVSL